MVKKVISLFFAGVILSVLFAGCSDTKEVNLPEMMNEINSEFGIFGLTQVEDADKLNLYYQIDASDVKQFAAEFSLESTTPTEVVLVEAVNADSVSRIVSALQLRFDSQKLNFGSYNPDAVKIFDDCKVSQNGNFVSMIISEQVAEITEKYNSYF